jgi:histidinol-phosphate aminotransferase
LPLRPKQEINKLGTYAHGGYDYAELKTLGLNPEKIIDFSVSTNPFMPPPGIKETLNSIPIDRYPDSRASELKQKLAEKLGINGEMILPANGTTELIRLAALTYFRRNDRVLIIEPTYGEYEPACILAGTRIIRYHAPETTNFTPDIKEIDGLIRRQRPRGVFICNPNNPTGSYLTRREIEQVLEALGNGLLIMDEAYISFVEKRWNSPVLTGCDNVLVLRSMTKEYGIPGLRLGYALACREIIESLRLAVPPWNVNIAAQVVGSAVLDDDKYFEESLKQVSEAKRFLIKEISNLGLKALPSQANYFLVKTGKATEFRKQLLTKGIQVRDCTSFGLPEYIRIAPRTMPECHKLIEALREILK